jgi:hypothetical protein
MPNRRAEAHTAMGRDESPADVQMTRAFIAVVVGLLLAFWVLIPECASPTVHALLPEFRALAGVPTLVI